jgi:hypothetical protein
MGKKRKNLLKEEQIAEKMQHPPQHELMELHHEPVPGYRPVFYGVFASSSLYLAIILYFSFSRG